MLWLQMSSSPLTVHFRLRFGSTRFTIVGSGGLILLTIVRFRLRFKLATGLGESWCRGGGSLRAVH